jgi:hypothetical protein
VIQTCCLQKYFEWQRWLGEIVVGGEPPKLVVQRPRRHEKAGWKPLLASCIVRRSVLLFAMCSQTVLSFLLEHLQRVLLFSTKVPTSHYSHTHSLIDCGDRAQPKQKGASCAGACAQSGLAPRAASLELDDTAALPGVDWTYTSAAWSDIHHQIHKHHLHFSHTRHRKQYIAKRHS